LQHSDFASVIFTRDKLEGTFWLSDIRIDAPNSADVILSFRCDGQTQNQFGVAGMIDADWNRKAGEGTHASLSPKDTHNLLVAAGAFFDVGREDNYPTSNLDLFPTILEALDVPLPSILDGRSLHEVMRKRTEDKSVPVTSHTLEASRDFTDGRWKQTLKVSRFPTIDYFDEGNGEFRPK
jgi:hypothetical protein